MSVVNLSAVINFQSTDCSNAKEVDFSPSSNRKKRKHLFIHSFILCSPFLCLISHLLFFLIYFSIFSFASSFLLYLSDSGPRALKRSLARNNRTYVILSLLCWQLKSEYTYCKLRNMMVYTVRDILFCLLFV